MPIAAHPRLLRWLITPAVTALAIGGLTGCDADHRSADIGTRQVTVVGTGEVQGSPDTLTADVAIEFTAPDAATAMNQTNERQRAVIEALIDAGVDRGDIATTRVNLQPEYGPGPVSPTGVAGPSAVTGYRAGNAIQVTVRDLESAPVALALIVSTGGDATRINSVAYSIDNDSELVRSARERAFDDAKSRAEQYAQLSGLRLGSVLSISELPGEPPAPLPAPRSVAAGMEAPLEPGQQTVSFSVTAAWELN